MKYSLTLGGTRCTHRSCGATLVKRSYTKRFVCFFFMAKRDVKNKPSHSDRTLLIAPLFFPSTAFAHTNHKHRHRDELNALPDTSQLPTIPPPGQPRERGVGAPKRGSSSRHYTGGV